MAETDVDAAENGFAKATQTADQNKTPQNTNYDTIEHKLLLIGIPRTDLPRKPVRELAVEFDHGQIVRMLDA